MDAHAGERDAVEIVCRRTGRLEVDAKNRDRERFWAMEQCEQDVVGADALISAPAGLLAGGNDDRGASVLR